MYTEVALRAPWPPTGRQRAQQGILCTLQATGRALWQSTGGLRAKASPVCTAGDFEGALATHKQAEDPVALVRLYCHLGDFVAASTVVNETDDPAATFLLARQLEATEQVGSACGYVLHDSCLPLGGWCKPARMLFVMSGGTAANAF